MKKFGLHTLIIENHMKNFSSLSYSMDFGWGMGYVLLPHNHPFYGKGYDDICVDAHGGLTFSQKFKSKNFPKWIKNREIDGDVTKENFEKFNNYWIIGFDTNHSGDNLITCSRFFVFNETNNLLEQCLSDDIDGMKKYKNVYLRNDKLKELNNLNMPLWCNGNI